MKRLIITAVALIMAYPFCFAQEDSATVSTEVADSLTTKKKKAKKPVQYNEKGEIIKTGLNFGPLPAIAFDADRGFQFGGLLNIYNFDDGSTYPDPKSSWYIEASAYVKESRISTHKYIVSYDNKHLTQNYNLRLSAAASLYFDTALSFYGFNGYESYLEWNMNNKVNSGFYRHSRTTATAKVDLTGEILKNFYWEAGYHFNWFNTGRYKDFYKLGEGEAEPEALIDLYHKWGIIDNPYGHNFSSALRLGLIYDSRDNEGAPSRGIWAEGHLIVAPKFLGSTQEYYKANVTFRHYVPLWKDRVVFAYRLNYQGYLGASVPWYTMPYYTVVGKNYDYDGIGGYRTVRGILQNRVQGKHTAFFNAEIRYRFIDFKLWNQNIAFAVSAFCDGTGVLMGKGTKGKIDLSNRTGYAPELYAHYVRNGQENIHIAAGGGLRFIMNKNFIVAIEYATAVNKQDNMNKKTGKLGGAFYINTGFLF